MKIQVTREEEHKGPIKVKERKVEEALFLDSVQRWQTTWLPKQNRMTASLLLQWHNREHLKLCMPGRARNHQIPLAWKPRDHHILTREKCTTRSVRHEMTNQPFYREIMPYPINNLVGIMVFMLVGLHLVAFHFWS